MGRRRELRPVLIVLLAFLPVIIVGASVVTIYTSSARDAITADRLARTRAAADIADSYITGKISTLQALAQTGVMKRAQTSEVNALVSAVVAQNIDFLAIGLSTADGFNVSSTASTAPRSVSIADRDYFQGAMAGRPTVGSVIIGRGTLLTKTSVIGVPITFDDGSKGVLSGGLRLERVARSLAVATPVGTELRVIDSRGQEFIGPDAPPDRVVDVSGDADVHLATSSEAASDARLMGIGGTDTLVSYARAPVAGWTVILRQAASAAFAVPDRELNITFGLAATGLVGALVVAWLVGRRLARTEEQVEAQRRRVDELARAVVAERDELQQLIDGVPEGIVLRRIDGTFVANEAARSLVGAIASDPAAIGTDLAMRHLDGTTYAPDEVAVMRALRGEEVHGEQVIVLPSGSDEDRTLLVSAAPVWRDGRVIAAAVIFQDISQLKALEAQRAEFFSVASHEIKTPVTAMHLQLQILHKLVNSGKTDRVGEMIERALGRSRALAELVTDLLEASRIESGRLTLELEETDLAALVRDVADGFPSDEHHQVRTTVPTSSVRVEADPRRVREILENLLTNAVKYSPDGGEVSVELSVEGAVARVRVRDHGFGVPASERAYVFDRFFRTSRARLYGGVGLGLYISRELARRHGGVLELETSSEHGSTFTLALPLSVATTDRRPDRDATAAG